MSFFRFITVDMLCIAAEITAALLLLAFAIPEKKKTAPPDANSDELDRLSTQARQYCVDSAVFRGLAILRAPDKTSFHDSEAIAETLRLVGYEDKLTHTANHAFADAFLSKWLRLPIEHRTGSSLAMIVVDEYSDLLRAKGAMEIEAILRRLSKMIKTEFGSNSIISRYQPDRFLILSFNGDIGVAYTGLVALRKKVSEIELDESTGHSAFDCTNSIVPLGEEDVNLQQAIEELDEGISQASGNTDKCVAKAANQEWSNAAPESTSTRTHAGDQKAYLEANLSGSASSTSSASSETGDRNDGKPRTVDESSETTAPTGNASAIPSEPTKVAADASAAKEVRPQSDVQAIAKNEDIEALFAQIKKNKKSNEAASEEPPEPNLSPPATETSSAKASEMDISESATADDIAALFATVKKPALPSHLPTKAAVSRDEPKAHPSHVSPEGKKNIEALVQNLNESASADEIEALFANLK
jgi:GGDEF domain-containing protein